MQSPHQPPTVKKSTYPLVEATTGLCTFATIAAGMRWPLRTHLVWLCSPPRAAVLEAVAGTATEKNWGMASGLSRTAQAPKSPSSSSLSQHTEASADISHVATGSQACSQNDPEADVQNSQLSSPSLSGSELPMSSVQTSSLVDPGPLPRLQTETTASDSFDDDESMSEESSGTAIMVGHPCSDEEDSAERRWRRAEQRGNDIRRASAPPCPRAVGMEGYLKVIVVSCLLVWYHAIGFILSW